MADWEALRNWLEGEGAAWTQWARMGSVASDIANDVLTRFGIEATAAARARLRREVDVAKFEPVPIRPWWGDDDSVVAL